MSQECGDRKTAMSAQTLPSRTWSCGTLQYGTDACGVLSTMDLSGKSLPGALKAWGSLVGKFNQCSFYICTCKAVYPRLVPSIAASSLQDAKALLDALRAKKTSSGSAEPGQVRVKTEPGVKAVPGWSHYSFVESNIRDIRTSINSNLFCALSWLRPRRYFCMDERIMQRVYENKTVHANSNIVGQQV